MRPDLRTLCAAHNGSDPCAQVYGSVSVCVCVWLPDNASRAHRTHFIRTVVPLCCSCRPLIDKAGMRCGIIDGPCHLASPATCHALNML